MINQMEAKLNISGKGGAMGFSPKDLENIRKIVLSETEEIVRFTQEFVNEFASNCIYTIQSPSKTSDEKMNAIDFIARNLDFISQK